MQGKKKRDAAAADAKRALDEENAEHAAEDEQTNDAAPNMLQEKDEDIIF